MRLRDKIQEAKALLRFVSLKADEIDYFRHNYPDFAPQDWWTYEPVMKSGESSADVRRLQFQKHLRKAWEKQFLLNHFELMRLLLSVFDPQEFFESDFGEPLPAFATLGNMSDTQYASRRAVLFLNEQKWRARLCRHCKSPYVAVHNRQRYCGGVNDRSETCFDVVRAERNKRDHLKHREARNRKRRAEYAKR